LNILRYEDYPVTPWKNGQGITRDIMKHAPDDDGFIWRLSLADVGQSGAFSEFGGYDRTITLLDGEGFSLNFDDGTSKTIDAPFAPYDFDGGATLFCELIGGPCRDVNLMVSKNRAMAEWRVHDLATPVFMEKKTDAAQLLFCLSGSVCMELPGEAPHALNQWDSALLGDDGAVEVSASTNGDTTAPSLLFHAAITVR